MDSHSFSPNLIAILVGDDAVDAAVVHIALHGVGVGGSLVAGNLKRLCTGLLDIPLIGQTITLSLDSDCKLLANFLLYTFGLLCDDGANVVVATDTGTVFCLQTELSIKVLFSGHCEFRFNRCRHFSERLKECVKIHDSDLLCIFWKLKALVLVANVDHSDTQHLTVFVV